MFGSTIIDVAIGLVFVYLLLSLICSAANEILENILRKRGKDLEKGIKELLNNDNTWVSAIYNHQLVNSLFEGGYKTGARNLPSYIPSGNFALALMDLLLPGTGATGATKTASATPGVVVNAAAPGAAAGPVDGLIALRAAIAALPVSKIKEVLQTLVSAAGPDPAKARENIEAWFNSSMDRVSGWYKRRSQIVVLIMGLVLAIALNADTIGIVRALSTDRTMRESLVAAAASTKAGDTKCVGDKDTPDCRFAENLTRVESLGLPIGWKKGEFTKQFTAPDTGLISRIMGWLLTALALSLGAPFWFDMLNKFIVVRSTVKPKEKSPDEPSKN